MTSNLSELADILFQHSAFSHIVSKYVNGTSVSLDGIGGGASALVIQSIARSIFTANTTGCLGPLLVLVPTSEQLDSITEDLELFGDEKTRVISFPSLSTFPTDHHAELNDGEKIEHASSYFVKTDELFGQRIRALKYLISENYFHEKAATNKNQNQEHVSNRILKQNQKHDVKQDVSHHQAAPFFRHIYVAPFPAVLQSVPKPEILAKKTVQIAVGTREDPELLRRFLVDSGYHGTTAVELPGEFAFRGSILDLFAFDWSEPVRIEFFGDEIDSIRRFDVATQRSLEKINEISLTRLSLNDNQSGSFFDYFPKHGQIILLNPLEIEQSGRNYVDRLPPDSNAFSVSETFRKILKYPTATISPIPEGHESDSAHLPFHSVERFRGSLELIRAELNRTTSETIFLTCPTSGETARLTELFSDLNPVKESRINFVTANLSAGFQLKLEQTFEPQKEQPAKKKNYLSLLRKKSPPPENISDVIVLSSV
ncbi:MAG: hypothetical protein ACRCUY_01645, partial [Thermoguttaceae bacterium]